MINIKSFKAGDTVYVLTRNTGRTEGIKIDERTVIAVGRKYVTVESSHGYDDKYEEAEPGENHLVQMTDFGEAKLLFKTLPDVEDYCEKIALVKWLSGLKSYGYDKYSLTQLRLVKEILNDNFSEGSEEEIKAIEILDDLAVFLHEPTEEDRPALNLAIRAIKKASQYEYLAKQGRLVTLSDESNKDSTGDLISRNSLLNIVDDLLTEFNWEEHGFIMETLSDLRDIISDEPSAYDLAFISSLFEKKISECTEKCRAFRRAKDFNQSSIWSHRRAAYLNALDIIENGEDYE